MGAARRMRKSLLARLYDAEAPKYEARYGAEQEPKVRDAIAMAPPRYPVLDAGCGTGILLRRLGVLSVGLDISPSMLRVAARGRGRELVLGDMERMPFRSDSFWTVYSITAVQLSEDLERALSEIARVVKAGGIVVVSAHRATQASRELDAAAEAAGLVVTSEREPDDVDIDRIVACVKPNQ
ncbi:MAG: class I SAM-dependent methyltransferase [Conexivisphaera sp.]